MLIHVLLYFISQGGHMQIPLSVVESGARNEGSAVCHMPLRIHLSLTEYSRLLSCEQTYPDEIHAATDLFLGRPSCIAGDNYKNGDTGAAGQRHTYTGVRFCHRTWI